MTATAVQTVSTWAIPTVLALVLLAGAARRVRVYDGFVTGAREGFQVAIRLIPYLVAILVAVGMFRASGAMDLLLGWVSPLTSSLGVPAEILPVAPAGALPSSSCRYRGRQ